MIGVRMNHFSKVAKEWDTPQKIDRNRVIADAIRKELSASNFNLRNPELEIMDLGCGTGILSEFFAPYTKRLIGVDPTKEMIEVFNQKFQGKKHITSECKNLESESASENMRDLDFIMSAMAFHHMKGPMQVLSKLKNMLKSEGKIFVIDLDQEDGSFHPDPEAMGVYHNGFAKEELQSWANELKMGLKHKIIDTIEKNEKSYPLAMAVFHLESVN